MWAESLSGAPSSTFFLPDLEKCRVPSLPFSAVSGWFPHLSGQIKPTGCLYNGEVEASHREWCVCGSQMNMQTSGQLVEESEKDKAAPSSKNPAFAVCSCQSHSPSYSSFTNPCLYWKDSGVKTTVQIPVDSIIIIAITKLLFSEWFLSAKLYSKTFRKTISLNPRQEMLCSWRQCPSEFLENIEWAS